MEIKKRKLSSRQMVMDICWIGQHAKQMLTKERGYNQLLQLLIEKNYFYYDEDAEIPSLKELSIEAGIPYAKIRKQIREIYEDLVLGYQEDEILKFSFDEVTYSFSIKGFEKDSYVYLKVDKLPVTPRVGEEIELPFFKEYLGTTRFYVESITHEFGPKGQEISISVKPGSYNLYWHYRKDKAEEEHEIPLLDFFKLDEYELKRKLGVGR